MKNTRSFVSSLCLAPALLLGQPLSAATVVEPAIHDLPGFVELGVFAPAASGGEFVEVNLQRALLRFAARIAAAQEPDVAALLNEIQALRINVVSLDAANRETLSIRASEIGDRLMKAGWDRVVAVQESDEHVHIYVKSSEDDVIQGLTLTVLETGGEAVFINVVGNIHPDQIATLAERFDVEPLKGLKHHNKS